MVPNKNLRETNINQKEKVNNAPNFLSIAVSIVLIDLNFIQCSRELIGVLATHRLLALHKIWCYKPPSLNSIKTLSEVTGAVFLQLFKTFINGG
jgi:hypothetical protein